MREMINQTGVLTRHYVRTLARQPFFMAFTLIQPLVYLVLFGGLFEQMASLDSFGATTYLTYLTPGVVLMTAVFAGGWAGMGVIQAHDRGIIDHLLATPVSRVAVTLAYLAQMAVAIGVQAVIVLLVGVLRGADLGGGLTGVAVILTAAVVLALILGSLSFTVALAIRKQESVVGAVNFVLLPLTFTASLFVPHDLMPSWIRSATVFNPVDWAAVAAREALTASPDWAVVGSRLAMLAALATAGAWLATRTLNAYQYSR